MNNFYLAIAAIVVALAIATAPMNLEKYRVQVCLEQYEIMGANIANEKVLAGLTLECMK